MFQPSMNNEVEQQAVLSSMNEGVLAIDRKERIIHMNRAAAEILEIDPKIESKKSSCKN